MRLGVRVFSTIAFIMLLALPAASATAAPAGTLYVDGSDTTADTGGCGSVANPCDTIQSGIDNAAAGDTVLVRTGTYAGAVVNKAVHLEAQGQVVINDGPFSHPGVFRAGFLFNPDRSGSGASIAGFRFVGAPQSAVVDDGQLDFGIFSRGADNVVVSDNAMSDMLQGISDANGTNWTIEGNTLADLWTICGGGIGIILNGNDGHTAIQGNVVSKNVVTGVVHVAAGDCGGYDADGIVIYADFRGRPGVPSISGNTVEKNIISLVSDAPDIVGARGLELTVAFDTAPATFPTVITGNLIEKNDVRGMSGEGIVVSDGTNGNTFNKNQFRDDAGPDAVDQSSGSGTAGTANSWTGNHCDTSNPAGLCAH